ncbi:MAG: hypothetical protein HXK69_00230 [Clostridiales bacterium]|nr:hypothetical protein [Clostridiales bacterium]MBF0987385.1 hypothetical protein [Clostridiales bacterium]MBF0988195.1 hypothetical protein [Clostridiales bacterium]
MSRRLRINIFTAVLVIFMIFATGTIFQRYIKINNVQKDRSVRADMLLIQGVAKVKKSRFNVSKKNEELVGVKVSDKLEDSIIKKFISDLEIPSEDYSKYYILYDDDLKKLDLEIRNADNSLYVVNYDTGEVYITKAYKGKYRLSEIDK